VDAATNAERRRAAWYDAHATRYDRRHPGLPGDVEFYAVLAAGWRVLEVGCGTGRVTRGLIRSAALVAGIDRSPAMLRQARAVLIGADAGRLLLADAPFLPFGPVFDLVLLTYRTVQHLSADRRRQLWQEARRVLREDGAIAFDTWLGRTGGRRPPAQPAIEPLTAREITSEVTAAGFATLRSAPFPPGAPEASLSRVWIATVGEDCTALERFHDLLDT
jgi:SAM-dependent methyltransferase